MARIKRNKEANDKAKAQAKAGKPAKKAKAAKAPAAPATPKIAPATTLKGAMKTRALAGQLAGIRNGNQGLRGTGGKTINGSVGSVNRAVRNLNRTTPPAPVGGNVAPGKKSSDPHKKSGSKHQLPGTLQPVAQGRTLPINTPTAAAPTVRPSEARAGVGNLIKEVAGRSSGGGRTQVNLEKNGRRRSR